MEDIKQLPFFITTIYCPPENKLLSPLAPLRPVYIPTAMDFNQTAGAGDCSSDRAASMHHFTAAAARIRPRRVCSLSSRVFTERGQWKSMEGKNVARSQGQNLARIIKGSVRGARAFLLGRTNSDLDERSGCRGKWIRLFEACILLRELIV